MSSRLKPTKSGGRLVEGDSPHGRYCVEWDADGNLIDHHIDIRDPRQSHGLGDTISKATKAMGFKECGGCRERRRRLNKIRLNKLLPYKQGR